LDVPFRRFWKYQATRIIKKSSKVIPIDATNMTIMGVVLFSGEFLMIGIF
jgi:hypothetical protein